MRRRPEPEALKALYEAKKILHETHRELLHKRYQARKALYEQQKEARLRVGDLVDFGVTSVRRPIGGERNQPRKRWVERPVGRIHPRTVRPELEERPPLVDVVDEGERLRINVQFRDIPWPEDIVGELDEVSFRHGVLELRLKKRKMDELTAEEERKLKSGEWEEVTAKVKEKLILKLKKRKEPEKPAEKELQKPEKKDLGLEGL